MKNAPYKRLQGARLEGRPVLDHFLKRAGFSKYHAQINRILVRDGAPGGADGAQLGASGNSGGGSVADYERSKGDIAAHGAWRGKAGRIHLDQSNVRGRVRADYLEAFILGGTYADEQSFVVMTSGGF